MDKLCELLQMVGGGVCVVTLLFVTALFYLIPAVVVLWIIEAIVEVLK